jgi:copper chaperone NosL
LIQKGGDVLKFDDIGCMDTWIGKEPGIEIAALFFKDYDSKAWLTRERAIIVETSIMTPMGSGKVAVTGSGRAEELRTMNAM